MNKKNTAKKSDFLVFLNKNLRTFSPIFFDGGMGTMIQAAEAQNPHIIYKNPEDLVFTFPDIIERIHAQYVKSGVDVITANTFGANALKMHNCAYTVTETVQKAVKLAKNAVKSVQKRVFVALDIGPSGQLIEPMGTLTFDAAYEAFKEVAVAAEKAGADLVIIETFSDLYEAKAAILAVKENTKLPVCATMTFSNSNETSGQKRIRTLTGADVLTCVTYLEALGVCALGFNCGGSLQDAFDLTEQFVSYSSVPVLIQPNAGIPVVKNGKTVFTVEAQEFADSQAAHYNAGALILGGCCGTTPLHIAGMIETILKIPAIKTRKKVPHTRVCSYAKTVQFNEPLIIGERINPTGKPKCKEALKTGNLQYIADEAAAQINAGAHILDVNTGLPEIDEAKTMLSVVKMLQRMFDIPLQIDTSDETTLKNALRYYNGVALINSVNGKKESMNAVFPYAAKYGGIIVALALDEKGIPSTAQGRIKIIERIVKKAGEFGIEKHRIIADALTLTISSRQEDALETLKTLTLLKNQLGVKTVLGVSNVSFGLPERGILNAHFLTAALFNGLDACIINPLAQPMRDSFFAYRALSGKDKNCLEYISEYAKQKTQESPAKTEHLLNIYDIILHGYTDSAQNAAQQALIQKTPQQIIDEFIIPALDEAGKRYEKGSFFLPQLLLCADSASKIFEVLKKDLKKNGVLEQKAGVLEQKTTVLEQKNGIIVLATVHGDVHDIGKNIVKALLENYGYTVIDLGKNVTSQVIIQTVLEHNVELVGLSALMTTTVSSMEKTIGELRKLEITLNRKINIMVGGAVLSESYAKQIGADFYAKDAPSSVAIAKKIFEKKQETVKEAL